MSKGILEFDLPEDREAFELAQKAIDYSIALEELYRELFRNPLKYTDMPDDKRLILEELRDKFIEICNEREVKF